MYSTFLLLFGLFHLLLKLFNSYIRFYFFFALIVCFPQFSFLVCFFFSPSSRFSSSFHPSIPKRPNHAITNVILIALSKKMRSRAARGQFCATVVRLRVPPWQMHGWGWAGFNYGSWLASAFLFLGGTLVLFLFTTARGFSGVLFITALVFTAALGTRISSLI
jgi:hypothetical protein